MLRASIYKTAASRKLRQAGLRSRIRAACVHTGIIYPNPKLRPWRAPGPGGRGGELDPAATGKWSHPKGRWHWHGHWHGAGRCWTYDQNLAG